MMLTFSDMLDRPGGEMAESTSSVRLAISDKGGPQFMLGSPTQIAVIV